MKAVMNARVIAIARMALVIFGCDGIF